MVRQRTMSARKSVSVVIGVVGVLAAVLTFVPMSFESSATTDAPAATQESATDDERPTLIIVGDSLSAGYGLADVADGWVALLQRRLDELDYGIRVVNASISGDTTQGGDARLPAALQAHSPRVVVIELGGNDGLRGIAIDVTRRNLQSMVTAAQDSGAKVALLGMRIPPNYGQRYIEQFEATFAEIADENALPMEPFFLAGVALDPNLMQSDGIHPNAEAQPDMLERAWPVIRDAIQQAGISPESRSE